MSGGVFASHFLALFLAPFRWMEATGSWIDKDAREPDDRSGAAVSWSTRPALPMVVVSMLLCLGAANITSRATWREVEDGVLWTSRAEGVVAAEIASGSSAERTGVRRGDVLISIDDRPVEAVGDV